MKLHQLFKVLKNVFFITIITTFALGIMPVQVSADSLLLWNKLGSEEEIANSEVGPGFELTNYLFEDWQEALISPAMFDNGLFVNHDTSEGWAKNGANFFATNLHDAGLIPEKGTVEFWFHFKYGSNVHNHAFFFSTRNALAGHFPGPNSSTNIGIHAGWNGWDYGTFGKRFFFTIRSGAGSSQSLTQNYTAAPGGELEFFDGSLVHFAFVWDASGIDGTVDTTRLYVNGNHEASGTGQWLIPEGFDPYLYLGSPPNYDFWDHYYNAVKGVTDNLKIWDYAKTDFSDRFSESGDTDGDGVMDAVDECIDEAGPADNNGCPLPQPPVAGSAPMLGLISNATVTEGDDLYISLYATDPDGDIVSLTGSGLWGFDVKDNGDGTGSVMGKAGNPGSHYGVVRVSDGINGDSQMIKITVLPAEPEEDPTHFFKADFKYNLQLKLLEGKLKARPFNDKLRYDYGDRKCSLLYRKTAYTGSDANGNIVFVADPNCEGRGFQWWVTIQPDKVPCSITLTADKVETKTVEIRNCTNDEGE